MEEQYDFTGLATKNDILCSDGRTIRKGAFSQCDGKKVPLIWNHQHGDIRHVLGHALLKVVPEGVRAFCKFNNTVNGRDAREMILNKDIESLSIWANSLQQDHMGNVMHGMIREVSLVLAGANPGAKIDEIMAHDEDGGEQAFIYCDQPLELLHSVEDDPVEEEESEQEEPQKENEEEASMENMNEETLQHAECSGGQKTKEPETKDSQEEKKSTNEEQKDKSVQEIINNMTEEQKEVMAYIVGQAIESKGETDTEEEEGGKTMKHNAFEGKPVQENVLSHADQAAIIELAQSSSVGSFQKALSIYAEENDNLAHSFENMGELFPEYKQLMPGAPELITRDLTWVDGVISGIHKSPYNRIKTRQANAKVDALKAKGYKKGERKEYLEKINLIQRSTDPQTIYVKDKLDRDDILDITDFDAVEYNWNVMKMTLNETLAMAIMVGDGRDESDPDKIKEVHIRPIWKDHNLYCIHKDVDLAKAKATLQGTNTNLYFSDNYIYAEAIIEAALYAREQYKGSGKPAFYCDPHLVNVMLLARDRNGRRIYETINDLVAALNVSKIETAEQFAGLTRKTEVAKGDAKDGETRQLLGLFVNLADYTYGCTKGGEITKFSQFDIDYNQEKMLLETRGAGALTRIQSAIALELPVEAAEEEEEDPGV